MLYITYNHGFWMELTHMISCSKVRVGRCKKGVGNVVQLYIKEEEWRTDEYNTR